MSTPTHNGYMLIFRGTEWYKGLSAEEMQQVGDKWMKWFKGSMASSVSSHTTRRKPTARLFLPSRTLLGLCGCCAHRKGWREGLLWTAPLCGEAKSKLCPELVSDVECSAAPELA